MRVKERLVGRKNHLSTHSRTGFAIKHFKQPNQKYIIKMNMSSIIINSFVVGRFESLLSNGINTTLNTLLTQHKIAFIK